MKRNSLFLLMIPLCVLSCSFKVNDADSGKEISTSYPIASFEKISNNGVCDIHYVQSDRTSLRVEGRENMINKLIISVDKKTKTLNIDVKNKKFNFGNSDIDIYVTSPDIVEVNNRGVGDVELKKIDTDTLRISNKGVGDIEIDGLVCDAIYIDNKGVGDIDGDRISTQLSGVTNKGVGDVELTFNQCGYLNCKNSGIGDIDIKGNVKKHSVTSTGMGSVKLPR